MNKIKLGDFDKSLTIMKMCEKICSSGIIKQDDRSLFNPEEIANCEPIDIIMWYILTLIGLKEKIPMQFKHYVDIINLVIENE